MTHFAIILNPSLLTNPDLDIRYALPDHIVSLSSGNIQSDGYDFVGPENHLAIFLTGADEEDGKGMIAETISNKKVLENDLRDAAICLSRKTGAWEVFYPLNYSGPVSL